MAVYEIPEFVKLGGEPQRVTVCTPDEIDDFLGARSARERAQHLQWLKDQGRLLTNKGKTFQQWVKGLPPRAYVFTGPASKVPKIGRGTARGVIRW